MYFASLRKQKNSIEKIWYHITLIIFDLYRSTLSTFQQDLHKFYIETKLKLTERNNCFDVHKSILRNPSAFQNCKETHEHSKR